MSSEKYTGQAEVQSQNASSDSFCVLKCLSDERPALASEAENMASLLKTNGSDPDHLSDRMHNFAEEVATLEKDLATSQATIQKQQLQLQELQDLMAKTREENRKLKEDNQKLQKETSMIASKVRSEAEPGWVTVSPELHTTSMMQYPDSPLMKRIDELQTINAKLFKANKDWYSKWEMLSQGKQQEREELSSNLAVSEASRQKLQAELASLTDQLQEEKALRIKSDSDLLTQREQVNELKSQLIDKDAEINNLKMRPRRNSSEQKEKDTQISLLEEQLALFMNDFENEKKDKQSYQEEAQRKERDLKLKDDKIKAKLREIERLQSQVAHLKVQIQDMKMERRPAEPVRPQALPRPSQATGGHMSSLMYTSGAGAPFSSIPSSSIGIGHRQGPEQFSGAWSCPQCTYINYPDRTICDICGNTKYLDEDDVLPGHPDIRARGSIPSAVGRNVPDTCINGDVVVD